MIFAGREIFQDFRRCSPNAIDFVSYNIPNNGKLYSKILMDNDIAKFCDVRPTDFWTDCKDFIWNILDHFTDNLQVSSYSVNNHVIIGKRIKCMTIYILYDSIATLNDVGKIKPKIPRHNEFRARCAPE